MSSRRAAAVIISAALVLLASIVVAVTIGPADVSAADVWASLAHHLGLPDALPGAAGSRPLDPLVDAMVWQLRLPRVLTAAAVGGGLAVCGVVMQALTRNPLADPYLLGLSSGASLGAAAVLVLGVVVLLPLAAFAGAAAALVATLALAAAAGGRAASGSGVGLSPGRAVLAGLAVGQLAAAGTSFVIFWSAQGDQYRQILSWLMGSVAGSTWASVAVAGIAALLGAAALSLTGSLLDAFAFGDTAAAALGVNVARVRWVLLVVVALLTGALVSQSGSIGFVGLVLPHPVRL
ncbi:MAG: iron chelate uptake ABC transporter family permease subunit, partial [Cellulomonadaceae bacterium]|nr:iron chelate uptake ABC transporter family permease subunit [Cellulomonadaceae bacterium]